MRILERGLAGACKALRIRVVIVREAAGHGAFRIDARAARASRTSAAGSGAHARRDGAAANAARHARGYADTHIVWSAVADRAARRRIRALSVAGDLHLAVHAIIHACAEAHIGASGYRGVRPCRTGDTAGERLARCRRMRLSGIHTRCKARRAHRWDRLAGHAYPCHAHRWPRRHTYPWHGHARR